MKNISFLLGILLLCSCAPKKISIGMQSEFLITEMNELGKYIANENVIDAEVSSVKVGWHIEHILLTISEIYKSMASSNPESYRNRPNITRMMMFSGNKIPRGRATAPRVVVPKNEITIETLEENYAFAKALLIKFDKLPENAYFKHPAAGYLNREDAKRFLKIHTEHHLKIIRDVLKVNINQPKGK